MEVSTFLLVIVIVLVFAVSVSFLGYFLVFLYQKNRTKTEILGERSPPYEAMKEINIKCPDLWVSMGVQDGEQVCKNYFNVPISTPDECYDDVQAKIKKFPTYNDFDKMLNDEYKLTEGDAVKNNKVLCEWKQKCGPYTKMDASWQGVGTVNGWINCD